MSKFTASLGRPQPKEVRPRVLAWKPKDRHARKLKTYRCVCGNRIPKNSPAVECASCRGETTEERSERRARLDEIWSRRTERHEAKARARQTTNVPVEEALRLEDLAFGFDERGHVLGVQDVQ